MKIWPFTPHPHDALNEIVQPLQTIREKLMNFIKERDDHISLNNTAIATLSSENVLHESAKQRALAMHGNVRALLGERAA